MHNILPDCFLLKLETAFRSLGSFGVAYSSSSNRCILVEGGLIVQREELGHMHVTDDSAYGFFDYVEGIES